MYIYVAKTKVLISFAVTAKLIGVFVFAYAKSRFSHNEAHMHQLSWRGCGSTLVKYLLTIKLIYNTAVDKRQVAEWRRG